jgi:hypothetical protein
VVTAIAVSDAIVLHAEETNVRFGTLLPPLLPPLPLSQFRHLLMLAERADQVPRPDLGSRDGLISSEVFPVRIGRDGIGRVPSAEYLREQQP